VRSYQYRDMETFIRYFEGVEAVSAMVLTGDATSRLQAHLGAIHGRSTGDIGLERASRLDKLFRIHVQDLRMCAASLVSSLRSVPEATR
jgi:hypothetical protein